MFAMLLCPYLVTRAHLFACVSCTPFRAGLCTLSHTRSNPALPHGGQGMPVHTPAVPLSCHQGAWAPCFAHLPYPTVTKKRPGHVSPHTFCFHSCNTGCPGHTCLHTLRVPALLYGSLDMPVHTPAVFQCPYLVVVLTYASLGTCFCTRTLSQHSNIAAQVCLFAWLPCPSATTHVHSLATFPCFHMVPGTALFVHLLHPRVVTGFPPQASL